MRGLPLIGVQDNVFVEMLASRAKICRLASYGRDIRRQERLCRLRDVQGRRSVFDRKPFLSFSAAEALELAAGALGKPSPAGLQASGRRQIFQATVYDHFTSQSIPWSRQWHATTGSSIQV